VETLKESLSTGQALGSTVKRLRICFVGEDVTEKNQANVLGLLGLTDNLQKLEAPVGICAPGTLATISRACAHTLVDLNLGYYNTQMADMSYIGQLPRLRRLNLVNSGDRGGFDFSATSPWVLPELKILSWETEMVQDDKSDDIHAIIFLARCHFPSFSASVSVFPPASERARRNYSNFFARTLRYSISTLCLGKRSIPLSSPM
jgi:hypothetical protein